MSWYRKIIALRKHVMRVDLHIHAGDLADFKDEQLRNQSIKSILSAAVISGLDVIGIVSHDGPQIGMIAKQISLQEKYDLFVIAGHEYATTDKVRILGLNIKEPIPQGLSYEQAAKWVHQRKGYVMVTDLTRRQSQYINKLKGTDAAPDGIELYNTAVGWYMDLDIDEDYQQFMNSAAKSANNLENTNVYTLINRKELEKMGLLPPGEGTEYVPKYLEKVTAEEPQQGEQNV
jgi:predicted metal-dependent phosphoesterase TrpH